MYEYEEKYKLFYEQYCSLDDGKASERVVEEVLKS
ncbi:CDP-glycerol glycerophosphotransferase family protein [Vagococcus lutrae]|nr:CDP-glycerol glycerophosphotransferase family protein [Vagococcus lutrae]